MVMRLTETTLRLIMMSTSSTTDVGATDDAARHVDAVDNAGLHGIVRVRLMMMWWMMLI